METQRTQRSNAARKRDTSPPAIYAMLFVGVSGFFGFATMIVAVVA